MGHETVLRLDELSASMNVSVDERPSSMIWKRYEQEFGEIGNPSARSSEMEFGSGFSWISRL